MDEEVDSMGNTLGFSNTLMRELAQEEPEDFRNITRMFEQQLNESLERAGPIIQQNDTIMREA